MNWEAVGALGEVLGAMTVLITLGYLAVQVRHSRQLLEENRTLMLSQVYQSRTDTRAEQLRFLASESQIASIIAQINIEGPGAISELSETKKVQLKAYYTSQIRAIGNVLYQNEIGLLGDADVLEDVHDSLRTILPVWTVAGCRIPQRVRSEYDALIAE